MTPSSKTQCPKTRFRQNCFPTTRILKTVYLKVVKPPKGSIQKKPGEHSVWCLGAWCSMPVGTGSGVRGSGYPGNGYMVHRVLGYWTPCTTVLDHCTTVYHCTGPLYHRILPCITVYCRVFGLFTVFYRVLPCIWAIYRVLPYITVYYRVFGEFHDFSVISCKFHDFRWISWLFGDFM